MAWFMVVYRRGSGDFMFNLSSEASEPLMAGLIAPTFTLPSQDGSAVSLEQLRVKWVLLYFYPKDNTPGCTIEAHNFQLDLPRYEALNTVVLGVSLDSEKSHQSFCSKQGLTFKLLSDTEKEVTAKYGSLKNMMGIKVPARNTFLIDPEGMIAKVWLGVQPASHSAEVLQELENREGKRQ
jgi:thioredoxin-dependent peroxiredoxin